MRLILQREKPERECVIGRLEIDGVFECYTLEDLPRPGQKKVYGETAIPAGVYKVIVTYSPRFKKLLPLLLAVPGFEGIRIHAGNSAKDTEGCILVGQTKSPGWIGQSQLAFNKLLPKLQAAIAKGEMVTIEVKAYEEGAK